MPTRSRVLHFAFPALLLAAQWALTLPAAAATRPDTEVPGAAAREVRLEPVHIGNAKAQHALSQSAPWRSFAPLLRRRLATRNSTKSTTSAYAGGGNPRTMTSNAFSCIIP